MFLEHLSTISGRIEGAIALSLVDRDGMPVESVSASPELDLEAIAAELLSRRLNVDAAMAPRRAMPEAA